MSESSTSHAPDEQEHIRRLQETERLARTNDYPGDLSPFWHPVATSQEVLYHKPRRFYLLGEPVVLFRDPAGVVAFKDLCIHRGAPLSQGEITPDGNLQCAYHGWTYSRDGMCVRIPSRPCGSPIPPKARVVAYRATEAYGLVWLVRSEPVAPVPPFPYNAWESDNWRSFIFATDTWSTSAGRLLENFCDWSHFPFVHENLLGTRDRTVVAPYDVWEAEYSLGFSWHQDAATTAVGARADATGPKSARSEKDWDTAEFPYYEYTINLPFTVHLVQRSEGGQTRMISMTVAPIGRRVSRYFAWLSRDFALDDNRLEETWIEFNRRIFEQDRRIVEEQRPEEIPLDLKEELHIKVPDAFSIEYRRALQKIGEVSPEQ